MEPEHYRAAYAAWEARPEAGRADVRWLRLVVAHPDGVFVDDAAVAEEASTLARECDLSQEDAMRAAQAYARDQIGLWHRHIGACLREFKAQASALLAARRYVR